jgi:hypothetical protein
MKLQASENLILKEITAKYSGSEQVLLRDLKVCVIFLNPNQGSIGKPKISSIKQPSPFVNLKIRFWTLLNQNHDQNQKKFLAIFYPKLL